MKKRDRERELERISDLGSNLMSQGGAHKKAKRASRKLGICSHCKHLAYIKTRLMDEAFWCTKFSRYNRLSTADPVEQCSRYWHVGWEDIWDLKDRAIFIEAATKRLIGFKEDNNGK